MVFELRALPLPQDNEKAYWFVFAGDKLLVELKEETTSIPLAEHILDTAPPLTNKLYLGRMNSYPCYATEATDQHIISDKLSPIGLRQLFGQIEDELFWLAARAFHLMNWSRNNRFCGRCGEKIHFKAQEHSKHCPKCNLSIYPKISPAVIVAITKDDKILLAKNVNNTTGFYSVLAGFVEPGENLEECVKREIKEEAGIEVKNIKYFGSQPWPFPDSLMLGFTAEYESGELILDPNELSDAGWFSTDALPNIPGSISISRKLIDWFVEAQLQKKTDSL